MPVNFTLIWVCGRVVVNKHFCYHFFLFSLFIFGNWNASFIPIVTQVNIGFIFHALYMS